MFGSAFFLGYAGTGVIMAFMRKASWWKLFIFGQTAGVFAGLLVVFSQTYI